MISQIKSIKDIGVFKNYNVRDTAIQKDFGSINLIYGLNTYGKSTLTDIFKDLNDNSSVHINNRISIPGGSSPKVVLQLASGQGVITLTENGCQNNRLSGKVMVFDSEFIHDNVFDGSELIENRVTKENFTDFILGDNSVKIAKELEILKRTNREDNTKKQQVVPKSQRNNTEAKIRKYAKQTINENEEHLVEEQLRLQEEIKQKKNQQINAEYMKEYKILPSCNLNRITNFANKLRKNQQLLANSFCIDSKTISIFEDHVKKNCNGDENAEIWLEKGISYLGDGCNCPFCGQQIEDYRTINALKEYLNIQYRDYLRELLNELNSNTIDWNVFDLEAAIVSAQNYIYKASKVFGVNVLEYNSSLESLANDVLASDNGWKTKIKSLRNETNKAVESKKMLGHLRIDLDITPAIKYKEYYENTISELNSIINLINKDINSIKNETLTGELEKKLLDLEREKEAVEFKITRIDEDDDCIKWLEYDSEINRRNKTIKELSETLEREQSGYLDVYFETINELFKSYGGRRFSIEKGDVNNKGYKKVYGINIKFNNVLINERGSTGCFFSESDKRALALAIFMAKIRTMSITQRKEITVVLDDPVTSFDNNRIKTVVQSIIDSSENIAQIFILTHLVTFAEKLCVGYSDRINCYIIRHLNRNSNGLYDMNPSDEFASEFMKAFNRIQKFNNEESDELTINDLRIFMEEYLGTVFASQIYSLELGKKSFGDKINALMQCGVISADTGAKLHQYRTALNNGSHTFRHDTIEDDRTFSIDLIRFVFSKVKFE